MHTVYTPNSSVKSLECDYSQDTPVVSPKPRRRTLLALFRRDQIGDKRDANKGGGRCHSPDLTSLCPRDNDTTSGPFAWRGGVDLDRSDVRKRQFHALSRDDPTTNHFFNDNDVPDRTAPFVNRRLHHISSSWSFFTAGKSNPKAANENGVNENTFRKVSEPVCVHRLTIKASCPDFLTPRRRAPAPDLPSAQRSQTPQPRKTKPPFWGIHETEHAPLSPKSESPSSVAMRTTSAGQSPHSSQSVTSRRPQQPRGSAPAPLSCGGGLWGDINCNDSFTSQNKRVTCGFSKGNTQPLSIQRSPLAPHSEHQASAPASPLRPPKSPSRYKNKPLPPMPMPGPVPLLTPPASPSPRSPSPLAPVDPNRRRRAPPPLQILKPTNLRNDINRRPSNELLPVMSPISPLFGCLPTAMRANDELSLMMAEMAIPVSRVPSSPKSNACNHPASVFSLSLDGGDVLEGDDLSSPKLKTEKPSSYTTLHRPTSDSTSTIHSHHHVQTHIEETLETEPNTALPRGLSARTSSACHLRSISIVQEETTSTISELSHNH
ncbi:uncharacterized protein EHS24_002235 [Apiotrichum porosum]|uniref:Uncharacterized protein n=1 Tax=Apiotrichum porosum TaxID=105984 RepID=A0A427XI05_9TREE|nr:uncharacterized protein EHS24_002235 [Apiotrichum porosum]RSH78510.1 hypothetical protein EHS24_002235 [Apiotrichum porosum]